MEVARQVLPMITEAKEEDWGTEYLDYILSVKTVSSIDEAIAHINTYNTGHSEAIITRDYANAQRFLNEDGCGGGVRERLHPVYGRV